MAKDGYMFRKRGKELVAELAEQVRSYQEYTVNAGHAKEWHKNRQFYENRMFSNGRGVDIVDAGSVGELKALTFNHFRNILRHMLNSLTSGMPDFDVSAADTTVKARRSVKKGKDIVRYYHRIKRVSTPFNNVAEQALVYGDGHLIAEWNPSAGEIVTYDEKGKPIREGEFEFHAISPLHMFHDVTKESKEDWDFATFRRRRNRYDIIALFPRQKAALEDLDAYNDGDLYSEYLDYDFAEEYRYETDDIYVYSTYHKTSPSMEEGKYILWAGNKENPIKLYEGKNPYKDRLPIFSLSPGKYMESCFGYTEANILRAPQMILTCAISYIVSNMEAFGSNNIWAGSGNITLEEIVDGMNLLKSSEKPEVISFYKENPDLVNIMNMAISNLETLSGQNAVIRGNVKEAPNLKSGIALATVIQQANQYSQALEQTYQEKFEDLYSFVLKFLGAAAKTERSYEMTGGRGKASKGSFKGEDLQGVGRVIVNRVNPIAKTPSGMVEIAMELLKIGKITPDKFMDVINTGNIEVATESDDRLMDYIWSVKERLLDGEPVPPIPGINHQMFVGEIQALLYDLDLTSNQENQHIVKNILDLIKGHMEIVANGDQVSALIYGGQQPMPPTVDNQTLEQPGEGPMGPPQAPGDAGGAIGDIAPPPTPQGFPQ